jgi:hypothetical protein
VLLVKLVLYTKSMIIYNDELSLEVDSYSVIVFFAACTVTDSSTQKCYWKTSSTYTKMTDAALQCTNNGGSLLVIEDSAEDTFVKTQTGFITS